MISMFGSSGRLAVSLIFAFVSVFILCEYVIYYPVIMRCSWPHIETEDSHSLLRALFLSDTHLLGAIRGHWLDKLRREWQMERAFQTSLWLLNPEVVFILGDVFDEGKWSSSQGAQHDGQCKHTENFAPTAPVLLQHYPLYRVSDAMCTDVDAAPLDERYQLFRERYDVISKSASKKLLWWFKPRLILSGHTHNGCEVLHEKLYPEISVPSFSWRNRNNPSFILSSISIGSVPVLVLRPSSPWLLQTSNPPWAFILALGQHLVTPHILASLAPTTISATLVSSTGASSFASPSSTFGTTSSAILWREASPCWKEALSHLCSVSLILIDLVCLSLVKCFLCSSFPPVICEHGHSVMLTPVCNEFITMSKFLLSSQYLSIIVCALHAQVVFLSCRLRFFTLIIKRSFNLTFSHLHWTHNITPIKRLA
ncbi:metallophosphoesterase 1 isoform X3 [Ctenopharyngodon idella]|uniref:metallophosphoesterase 1 isoform X3 n=1 Tax=Ctenopharyngodon idella TaxID=7959 RepID=UPI00222F7888|nr:metallophosphoesterase 1 isoform X3 [Ctenopharyngodon idella]